MFGLYGTGEQSICSLVAEMGRRGITKPNGNPLSTTGIEKVLNYPFYTYPFYTGARRDIIDHFDKIKACAH